MHRQIIPASLGVPLSEFNHCHAAADGRFCSGETGAGARSNARSYKAQPKVDSEAGSNRPVPIKVTDLHEAVRLILAGRVVELPDTRAVNTVLSKLAEMAIDAERKGEKAPNYNLCNVSVAGSNLFCTDSLGVSRLAMPQMSGTPVPGSPAAGLPHDKNGMVNGAEAFIEHLAKMGVKVTRTEMPAARLKATQSELIGPKVAVMMANPRFDAKKYPIFVSRDHYVVDGHHRWAAAVGVDAKDGHLGNTMMNVIRIDAPISEVLLVANRWSRKFGIKSKGLHR